MPTPGLGTQTPRRSSTRPGINPFTPPIPAPTTDVSNLKACVEALKVAMESLTGQRGDAVNRAVTFRDLASYNLLSPAAITSPSGGPDYGSGTTVVAADPSAIAGDVAVPGAAVTFMRSDAAPAVRKATSTLFGLVKPDGASITVAGGVISAAGAAPTAVAKDTAVPGAAPTFMRSDAAPAVQKASASLFGLVRVDGTSITSSSGVISATPGGGGGAVSAGGPWDMTAAYPVASVVRYHGAFYQSNAAILPAPAPATPTLDGSLGGGGQGSSVSWTGFSTTLPNDVLIAVITINSSTTITSPPSIPGAGTFTRIAQQITGADTTEVWWAPAPTVITNQSLTVGFSANTDHGLSLQAIHGASLVAPFDPDPTLPAKANGSAVTAKTTNAYDFVIYWHRGNTVSFGTYLTPVGFTVLNGTAYVPVSVCTSYQSRTTVMPSTVLDAASGAEHCGVLAITSPVNPPPPTDARWVLMAIADSAALDGAYGTTPGTILVRGASTWTALAPGGTAQILTMVGGAPAWANAPSGGGGGGGLFAPMLSNVPTRANTGLSTWVNQGTATVAETPMGLSITSVGQSGDSLRMLTKAALTAPYKITALVANNGTYENYNGAGIGWYDGTKVESINIGFTQGTWNIQITRWSSVTSFGSQDLNVTTPLNPIWFQIEDDGTTVYFRYSADGYNFVVLYKTTKAAGFLGSAGYSTVVFAVNRNLTTGTEKAAGTLLSYSENGGNGVGAGL